MVTLGVVSGAAGCVAKSSRASSTVPASSAVAALSCPSSSQLLTAWHTAPESVQRSWASPTVAISGFSAIQCWNGWAVAVPQGVGNGYFVFTQSGGLHLLSPAELQEFMASVCSSPAAPAAWKSPIDGPAGCQG
jgi:hypothetical protein